MLRNTRSKLVLVLVAALAASALVSAAGVGAQRTGSARQSNQNAGGDSKKRVFIGRGSETRQGSRVTITADDSLKDYSAYRSGDRFYVVLPKSAAGAGARGGSGRGYSDMQVQQRGDSVVLSYRVQPGAKPRVEQKFNRLDVVFDVPGGGGQQQPQAAATSEASRTQTPPAAETRNQTDAAQQSNRAADNSQTSNPNAAAARANAAAEAARNQAANASNPSNPSNAVTTPPVVTAEPPPSAAADPNAQPGATPATGLTPEGAPAATPAAEPQLAQAQPPASNAPVSITKPATGEAGGASLGALLLRNWALTAIIALVVVGLGLIVFARRTTAATPAPVERADADGGAAVEPRASRAKETSAAALGEASAAAQASTLKASTLKATTPEVATPKAATPEAVTAETATSEAAALKTSTPDTAEAATLKTLTPDTVEAATPDVAEVPDADAKPLVGAAALAGGAAVAKSRKQSRKDARQEARKKKKGSRADGPETAETLAAAPSVQEPAVEAPAVESSVEEPIVEESVVEESAVEAARESAVEVVGESAVEESAAEETFVEAPSVEESRAEVFAAAPPPVEETTAEEVAEVSAAPEVEGADTSSVETPEFVGPSDVAADETGLDATDEVTAVGVEAAPAVTGVAPFVAETFAPEAAEPEAVEAVEPEAAEAEAPAASTAIEPAFAPEPERVQAETRQLLEGGAYDRAVIGTHDPVARQMIAAELLSALAGRNPQRRERAGAAFVAEGYYDETARDLRAADAPAERAAAARSLALLGDRAATPLLVNALEDASLDVRRAAVEALGALRDPAAVAPLEALLERERNERHRIPPRVIRVAADSCREAAAELAAAGEAPAAEVGRADTAASVELEPAAEVTLETEAPYVEPESAQTAEVAAHEAAEESSVSVAPYAEEQEDEPARQYAPVETAAETAAEAPSHTTELVSFDHAREDEEETLVAEAPAAAPEVDPLVADLSEELNAAESRSFESAVAEPEAVAETGIQPFAGTEGYAQDVVEPFALTSSEEVALEPFREADDEELTTRTYAPAAESGQATLFDEGAAEESTRELAPFQSASSDKSADAGGEWFDFDMQELRAEQPPAEPETPAQTTAAPTYQQEEVFESSSGNTFTSYAEAGTSETYAAEESRSFADLGDEATRGVEAYGAGGYESEEAAPAATGEKGLAPFDEFSTVPASIQQRLASRNPAERAAAIVELSHVDSDEAFQQICAGFDDPSREVRNAAARALYELRADRAESFTRALREANAERRRGIGMAISASGLAGEAISQLTGESREKTYEAFSLLFLMAKAGEVQPLVRAIEGHPSSEVRLAVVKLLALSGQKEILPAFRRLAVRGSLPTEVRSAVMEAIYQISSSQPTPA